MEFYLDIHDPQRMNPDDFGDPRAFPLAPPWHWHLFNIVSVLIIENVKLHHSVLHVGMQGAILVGMCSVILVLPANLWFYCIWIKGQLLKVHYATFLQVYK